MYVRLASTSHKSSCAELGETAIHMAESLVSALERVHVSNAAQDNLDDNWIDDILNEQRPRKRVKQEPEDLKRELEEKYLTPSTSFSTEWLNKLQQRWDAPVDYTSLFQLAPTQTRTITRFTREGLEGKVTGYKEVTVPANSATAKNSTSFLRKPANRADFVRGAAGFFPFAPGGLEGVEAAAALEEQAIKNETSATQGSKLERVINFSGEGGLLEVAPGLARGLDFTKKDSGTDDKDAEDIENVLEEEPVDELAQDERENRVGSGDSAESSEAEGEDDIDSMLPVEFPALEPRGTLATSSAKRGGREWAHMVDVKREITNFRELVPDMAREWPFELDTFQKEAVYHLENGDSVFVAAHTSAGKTVVAEYAIALAAKHMTKAIYTSPIKALSNQKFRDFREVFDEVGILTGDVQISPEASCLIMTTEILRSMLYRGADIIRDVEFVIFDEVHYVNDLERGVVWEEVIIMLPEHVTLILLSATVPNTYEFASWVGRTKHKDIYVISTPKRPVPLEHYLWADKGIHKIVDSEKRFIEKGWKSANDVLSGRDKVKALPPPEASSRGRGDGNARGGRGQNQRGGAPRGGGQQRGGGQRGGAPQRGRGGPPRASHAPGHMGQRGGRQGGRTSAAQDKTLWVHLVQFLKKETLLPACIFVFSKKRCEENADALSNQDFCTATEKSAIHMIIEKSIARLKPEDRLLPQIVRLRDLLGRGIAVHHGGLLPIVKEVVEMLFAQTLVKVLFATETFAMGLNLPTRTVVFSGYRKHDGHSFRNLLPGEYTQMAGRAGRRGLDTVGSVIIVAPGGGEAPPVTELRQMILGEPSKLRSQFRLTYNMILNLLRVEALKIEEMIKRSFSEHATQQLLPEHEKQVKISEADLAKIKREPCDICDVDLELCHESAQNYKQLTLDLHLGLLATPVGRRTFARGRLVVYNKDGIRTPGILLRDGAASGGAVPTLHLLEIKTRRDQRDSTDLLPYLPKYRKMFTKLPLFKKHISTKTQYIPVNDLEVLTQTVVKSVIPSIFEGGDGYKDAVNELLRICESWETDIWNEVDWSRIKEIQLRDIMTKRNQEASHSQKCRCLSCPQFLKHFAMRQDEWIIKENISQLRQLMSDQNLQLLPDYEQRIQVLKDLEFIDDNSRVQLKGKVACEIHSADELVLTELILDNVLAAYEPAEIVALLSAFVFQEKTDTVPNLTGNLENGMKTIIEISEKVNERQTFHQVILSSDDSNDFVSRPRFGLMEVVYEWARGMSFKNITDLTDVLEGTIVRVITRLDETCREVKNAARIIGDPELFTKMQTCQEMIKRDITAVASLYM
ncbi:ATP-dependent RNA helicase [Phlyctema vagabunda]|uniref:ATP-dependent RNA helicase n=1 Tax=Phlyctema vagabunda TaxID=108571 RepID=A0ABR4P6N1_9HELO